LKKQTDLLEIHTGSPTALPEVVSGTRDIPSLDGLRAFSIIVVILSHSTWYFPAWIESWSPWRLVIGNGRKGVDVFFVISGFLITTLLMREIQKHGSVSLSRFYFRRTFRIFPPFYVFIAVMAILWVTGVVPEHLPSFLASATYTWTYYPFAHGYEIAHTWSLSVEEQFYLFWPLAFLFLHSNRKRVQLTVALIAVMPLVRLAVYFLLPSVRGFQHNMLQQWIDAMMVGCLLALVRNNPAWQQWHRRYLNGWTAACLFLLGFCAVPYLDERLPHMAAQLFTTMIGPTITALSVGGIVTWVVEKPESIAGRLLNWRPIVHIGIISYSLYLWQQIFVSHESKLLPWGWLCALAAAETSFWLVERPSLKLRNRLERRIHFKRPASPSEPSARSTQSAR
jgi:peptidoglycan/LPS O-acetylase OafA/YrhL